MMTNFGMGFGWLGMLFVVIFWIALIASVIWLLSNLISKQGQAGKSETNETAITILEKRYARGEIDKEKLETMRHNLEHE